MQAGIFEEVMKQDTSNSPIPLRVEVLFIALIAVAMLIVGELMMAVCKGLGLL